MSEWKQVRGALNMVRKGHGFYVSYHPGAPNNLVRWPETALKKGNGDFLILMGDHRKEYDNLIDKGYEACEAYYRSVINRDPSKD